MLHFQTVLKILPEGEITAKKSKFWLATFGKDTDSTVIDIDRCPEEYIISLYSAFACNFDQLLVEKLNYETPKKLRLLVAEVQNRMNTTSWCCADLGCGTGISSLAFGDCVNQLVGIDLSPEMIQKAREKGCYDKLIFGDLETIFYDFKGSQTNPFDLIIACNVFVYIGDLFSVFHSVRKKMHKDGLFAFSTEFLKEKHGMNNSVKKMHKDGLFAFSTEFLKEKHGMNKPFIARFAHKKSYIEELAKATGFVIKAMRKAIIRKNQGENVYGLLVVLSF